MAIVLQDTVLFSDTVLNNLKYANAQATQDEKNIDIRSFARYNTDRQEVA